MASLLSPYGQVGKWVVEDELYIGHSHSLDLCVLFIHSELLKNLSKKCAWKRSPRVFLWQTSLGIEASKKSLLFDVKGKKRTCPTTTTTGTQLLKYSLEMSQKYDHDKHQISPLCNLFWEYTTAGIMICQIASIATVRFIQWCLSASKLVNDPAEPDFRFKAENCLSRITLSWSQVRSPTSFPNSAQINYFMTQFKLSLEFNFRVQF